MGTSAEITSPLKWHGGKYYLTPKLVRIGQQAPGIVHRVEVFGGSMAWTLANSPEGFSEAINDVHGDLMNFWRVLQSPRLFKRMQRALEATPFSRPHWRASAAWLDAQRMRLAAPDPVEWAVRFFIFARQTMAGRLGKPVEAPLSRTRTRRGMNEQASAWLGAIKGLPVVHNRIQRVVLLEDDFGRVITTEDGPQTLFYFDPTYLPETRKTVGEYGTHEMDPDAHGRLLAHCTHMKGRFILSGYDSELYRAVADGQGWHCVRFELPNNAAGGKVKERKVECVWTNFPHDVVN